MKQNNNSNHLKVEYVKFIPGGNDTALVLKKDFTAEEKKAINDVILKNDTSIEQVGFVDADKLPELQMAGGEFCGNATRSAAFYYLNGKPGKTEVIVNGKDVINAGVYENGDAWCEIPLYHGNDVFVEKEPGIYQVKMNGMVSIVIQEDVASLYLQDKSQLKSVALKFIDKYELRENEAVGIMFLERTEELKIHPVVWVRDINTLYYETGCGSGTTATAMVEAFLKKENQKLEIVQPSGLAITAEITIENEKVVKAVISGKVNTDNKVVAIDVFGVDMEYKSMKEKIRKIEKENYEHFYKMYKIFEKPPYSEKFSDKEILDEYELLTSGGHVYGYYDNDNCVGLVTYNKMILYNHPIHYEHPEKVAYLSDVTVSEEYRGKGIGTMLMKYALTEAKKEGYNTMYMRTLQPGQSMSYGIALKLGFKTLDETEIVVRERHDENRDITDERIFLEIDLTNFEE